MAVPIPETPFESFVFSSPHPATPPDVDPFANIDLHIDLQRALRKLSAYDLLLLNAVFSSELSLEHLGELVHLSSEGVRKQVNRTLKRLRTELEK